MPYSKYWTGKNKDMNCNVSIEFHYYARSFILTWTFKSGSMWFICCIATKGGENLSCKCVIKHWWPQFLTFFFSFFFHLISKMLNFIYFSRIDIGGPMQIHPGLALQHLFHWLSLVQRLVMKLRIRSWRRQFKSWL